MLNGDKIPKTFSNENDYWLTQNCPDQNSNFPTRLTKMNWLMSYIRNTYTLNTSWHACIEYVYNEYVRTVYVNTKSVYTE